MAKTRSTIREAALAFACAAFLAPCVRADDAPWREELRQLREENQQLRQQLQGQQQTIDSLSHKVDALGSSREPAAAVEPARSSSPGKVIISGEGGLAFFDSGSDGQFPNSEFRVDEAKLFLDAQVIERVYFFTELNITTRELMNTAVQFGELYVDFEEVSRLWGNDRLLNVRVGRLDIPFGEEYLSRDAIDNPLISHSVTDFWGVDEGVEIYGAVGRFDYVVAVQNGGADALRDFDADKSVAGRIGFQPSKAVRVSVSAMRTGDLDATDDFVSELWLGSGLVRSLGGMATTTKFHAEVAEADVQLRLPRGHVKAAGGYLHYDDDDTAANNERDVYFYYVEALLNITEKFYGVTRFSHILADGGFPIVGNGNFDEYFYEELTTELWRLSLGLGYRWSPNLVLKAEYSVDRGEELGGDKREDEDLFAAEVAFGF